MSGAEFEPDTFLGASTLEPRKVFRRGEARLPRTQPDGPRHEASGIRIVVSEAPWSDLLAQVADAERFLEAHRGELERLVAFPGVEDVTLDFPIHLRIGEKNVYAQFDRFPASLVRLAGALGIALELSIYPAGEDARAV